MPCDAPSCKRAAVEGYGATVTTCERTAASRVAVANAVEARTPNSIQIPSYNHRHVMAGQGTTALELLEQAPNLDALVVPVGGGGLISGIAVAAKGINPSIKIFAAEPAAADDCARSKSAGRLIPHDLTPSTVADGLKTSLGSLTWPIMSVLIPSPHTPAHSFFFTTSRVSINSILTEAIKKKKASSRHVLIQPFPPQTSSELVDEVITVTEAEIIAASL